MGETKIAKEKREGEVRVLTKARRVGGKKGKKGREKEDKGRRCWQKM